MAGTLYSYEDNFRVDRILIAAKLSDNNDVQLAKDYKHGETNKKPDFLKKFPLGRVPAFETAKGGDTLFETNAITEYVSNDALCGGNDKLNRAKIIQWVQYADQTLLQPVMTLYFQAKNIMQPPRDQVEKAKKELSRNMQFLNESLKNKQYFVGNSLTLADIAVFTVIRQACTAIVPPETRKQNVNLQKWFDGIAANDKVKAVIGETKLCDKEPESLTPQAGGKKKGGDKGPAQQQKQQQKKEEKPKQQQQPKTAADFEEEEEKVKEKPKDPLAHLPAGSFNFDEFKRVFSNNPTDVAIDHFWKNFDPETHSIWFCEYKHNDELTLTFMSANLIGGMYQRIEKLHKYAFASMCVWGKNNDNAIQGVWVWRGQDLIFEKSPDWQVDYGVYEWKKLDPKADETKKLVDQFFREEGTFKGKEYNDGKIFK